MEEVNNERKELKSYISRLITLIIHAEIILSMLNDEN